LRAVVVGKGKTLVTGLTLVDFLVVLVGVPLVGLLDSIQWVAVEQQAAKALKVAMH
jgi:hypothetical protein